MSKKNKKKRVGVMYSTDPDFDFDFDNQEVDDIPIVEQKLRVIIDRKKRKGKEVTLVLGFVGTDETAKALGKFLKTKCGVGGAVKDGEILVQGNQREKVINLLKDKGYSVK